MVGISSDSGRTLSPLQLLPVSHKFAGLPVVVTESVTYERRKKQRPEDSVTDQGLRFNDDVPVEVILMKVPEMEGEDADHRSTYRLAQRPGSYVILNYQREVVRHKPSLTLTTVAAPSGLFDRSFADVSFIAGMLVDKYLYHLPLYRQHQRLEASGITISRGTLTNLEQRAAQLLQPVAREVLNSCLESETLALDETLGKTGRKSEGKMQTDYFWSFYGDRDEVAFLPDVLVPVLPEIVINLHIQPKVRSSLAGLGQTECHLNTDR